MAAQSDEERLDVLARIVKLERKAGIPSPPPAPAPSLAGPAGDDVLWRLARLQAHVDLHRTRRKDA